MSWLGAGAVHHRVSPPKPRAMAEKKRSLSYRLDRHKKMPDRGGASVGLASSLAGRSGAAR